MKRKGTHQPTIEDAIEISGIEILHPGGFELTRRTAELCEIKKGMKVLDVSSGRGTQAIYYAAQFGAEVTGLDISEEMIQTATRRSMESGTAHQVKFVLGDSQNLPFACNSFDVVINECAVGIPDNSQMVIDEMLRVAKPNGTVAIHESCWKKTLSENQKDEIAERYGTTPLETNEWKDMLEKAGAVNILCETEPWSRPDMFWNIRKNRKVKNYKMVMTPGEKLRTAYRVYKKYGIKGVIKVFQNEKYFFESILRGEIGYSLFKGVKAE